MKILLDTNIVVYRESNNSLMQNIGELFRIIDNDSNMQKYINPIIKKEISQSVKDDKRLLLLERLKSYNILENSSKSLCEEIKTRFSGIDKTQNDLIDSFILNDVYTCKADLLITEDKKLKQKALELDITKKVINISEFIYWNKTEKRVNHDILDIIKVKMGSIDINDSFFDDLKLNYIGFEKWFNRKKEEEAYCYYQGEKLKALLFLKNEEIGDDDYSDIKPNMRVNRKLKISTFKVEIEKKKIGERFMKIIFNQAIYSNVDEIYVTIFDNDEKKINLIRYFENFGFEFFGKKNGKELVYIRQMKKRFCLENPLKSYPYIKRSNDSFVIPIKPDWHTYLLPDSKLNNEVYSNTHMAVEYAIKKYYITAAGFIEKPKTGDNIIFYRTKQDPIPAKYSSVITTIGVVTNIIIPTSIDELCNTVKNKTVYSEQAIRGYYVDKLKNTYVIEFAYVTTLENKINFQTCLDNEILYEAPRGVQKISTEQFNKILEIGNVDSSIII